jgi:signal transduction histidine kinase
MTLRARLGWGLLAIAVVLIIPLLLSIRSLEQLYGTTRLLRDREFAASLLLGTLRERTDDTRRAEDALLFIHDEKSSLRMQRQIDTLFILSDSLQRYRLELPASQIRASLDALRSAARDEFEQAAASRATVAEMISSQRTRPAIAVVDSAIEASASLLRTRTRERISDATAATLNAERFTAGALVVALLIAAVIALWLMRSIARPVKELDRGMRAISEGDLAYQLRLEANQETEFGRLAASYQTMARQLAELERLRAEFVGVASHELKTPINVIIGYLDLMKEGLYGDLTDQQKQILETISKQAHTLTRLVKRLLDISRFEASGGKVEIREIQLQRFLKALESSFSVLAMQRGISFSIDHRENLPERVYWDEDRINEVLGNLLSNAFKFTERDGRVGLTVSRQDKNVVITVADTGAGIPPEQLPHIFDKFFQADNQAQAATKGTGLGLAIAREIVEAHGGGITANSKVGEGTTFTVTLPIEPKVPRRQRETQATTEEV